MFTELYKHLKNSGLDVYSIGQHTGLCTSPYLVIKENGENGVAGTSLVNETIELMLYYPLGSYSKLADYSSKVKLSMNNFSKVRRIMDSVPTVVDDDKKAYMTSYYYRKIKTKEGA